MPDPIQFSTLQSSFPIPEGATASEDAAQMSLTAEHPAAPASAAPAPTAAAPALSPGASALVSRFSAPSGQHPVAAPSLAKAALDCTLEAANLVATTGSIIVALPETLGASLFALTRVGMGVASVERCINRDMTQQTSVNSHASQAADCASQGAVALTTADGSVICEAR